MAARANREPGVNKRTLIVWLYVSPNFFRVVRLLPPPQIAPGRDQRSDARVSHCAYPRHGLP